jgi:serine protease Do
MKLTQLTHICRAPRAKRILKILFVFICFSGLSLYAQTEPDFTYAAKKAKPSVVYISVFAHEDGNPKNGYLKTGYGSGNVVTKDGYILTNYHVVNKGEFYQVVLSDGTECEVEKINGGSYYLADEETDLAVLKVKHPDRQNFVPFEIGDSDLLQEGQWVIAIGNPYGLRHSVTCGIVSSLGRSDVGFADIEDFIQTDVPINPGNSGGALVDRSGELIGINAAIRTVSGGYQGISFAIPSKLAVRVFRELLENGRVRRGWLGVVVKMEKRRTDSDTKDIRIISVAKNSPTYDAGIREGDIIRKAEGIALTSQGQLMKIAKNKNIGSTLSLTISRDGKLRDYNIVLREKDIYRNLGKALSVAYERYGLEFSEDSAGLVISRLSPLKLDSHNNSLREGDVLLSINGGRIKGLDDFVRLFTRWEFSISKATVMRASRVYVIDFKSGIE